MTLEERVSRLESFIGDIDEVTLFGNSLQDILDKYISPLYIESGSANEIIINDYLGSLTSIPRNVIFKIRASHDLDMTDEEEAYIKFSRPGITPESFQLRKYSDGLIVPLESGNYTDGTVYDIYINSQDIAIITSNDAATLALSEITGVKSRMDAVETKLSGINRDETGKYTMPNLTTTLLTVTNMTVNGILGFGAQAGAIILPNGSMIVSTPSNANHIPNKKYVDDTIASLISNYHSTYHITGTQDAAAALSGRPNGAFYYKLES